MPRKRWSVIREDVSYMADVAAKVYQDKAKTPDRPPPVIVR